MEETKNLIIAAILSLVIVMGWYLLFPPAPPPQPAPDAPAAQNQANAPEVAADQDTGNAKAGSVLPRDKALAQNERIAIKTPALSGSFTLKGGRIDDLHLSEYRETLDPKSDTVILLNPAQSETPYYVDYGWLRTAGSDPGPLPNKDTPWTLASGDTLAPGKPVSLHWDNGAGLEFTRTYSIDERYLITVTQEVTNKTDKSVSLAPFGYVARLGDPKTAGFFILHEGAVGYTDGELEELKYSDFEDLPANAQNHSRVQTLSAKDNGWLGFTDKYWMTTLAGKPGQGFDGFYQLFNRGGVSEYRATMRQPVAEIAPGTSAKSESFLFAGAKVYKTLTGYEKTPGIADFHQAIDWGWFYFLTTPIFRMLDFLYGLIGNMGVAIILLTFLIKAVLFPLAYKSYVSMSRMKKLQPQMQEIKERAGDDKQKMQQEMMALYKTEKVNPASGCLPILLQIPIFFSLYKVIFVTIELRHAPFIWWIQDLSAPDPSSFINLFGLLPISAPEPGTFLAHFSIGLFPILMGITMWLQQKLNPMPTEPTQAMIFAWMPWVFMFMLGHFASGLVIYWCANNILTFTQQYFIMRSQGVDVDLLGNIKHSFKRKGRNAGPETKGDPPKVAKTPAPAKNTSSPRRKRR